MKNIEKYLRYFRTGRLNRKVMRIAIPSSLGMMSQTAVMISDTAMVGSLGVSQQAATGLGGMIIWTIMAFLMGGSTGVQIIVSRRVGEKNITSAGQTLVTALLFFFILGISISLIGIAASLPMAQFFAVRSEIISLAYPFLQIRFAGVLFYLINYGFMGFFNATGKTRIAMFSSLGVALSNIILNWIFIFGNLGLPAYGVMGAAIASSIAGLVGVIIFIGFIFQKQFRKYFVWRELKLRKIILMDLLRLSFAPSLEGFLIHLSFLVFYKLAAGISTVSVAATNIVVTIMSISFMPGYGFGIAALTMLGQGMGAKKYKLARFSVYRSANYAAVFMGVTGLIFILFRRPMISLFTNDINVIEEAMGALVIVSLVQVGDAYQMVMSSALRGAGYVYWVLRVNGVVSFFIMIPLAYYLGIFLALGTTGLWGSVFVWFIILGLVFRYKFVKGNWVEGKV